MFNWLRNSFRLATASTNSVALGAEDHPNRVETSRDPIKAEKPAGMQTKTIFARLAPELSRLAAQESISCQTVPVARSPVPELAVSRRRQAKLRRFSRRFTGMTVGEAKLLVAIHRGSLRAIAADNAGQLHRDMQRFLLSTRGQIAFNGKNAPAIEKIRQWVTEARQINRTRAIDHAR